MILFASLLAFGQVQAVPEMRVETLPGRGYAVTVEPFLVSAAETVQARLEKLASERCGKLTVRFGRFTYDNRLHPRTGEPSVANYRQSFQRIDPATDPYRPVATDWKPDDDDIRSVTAFAQHYLTLVDKEDAAAATPLFGPMLEITRDQWLALLSTPIREAGANGAIWRAELVKWENNPNGAAHPGAYATFWVSGTHKGLAGACGMLLIYRVARDQYQISQQNIRLIAQSKVDAGEVTADAVRKMCE